MTLLSVVNIVLSLGVLVGQIGILLAVLYVIFFRKKPLPWMKAAADFLGKRGLLLAFLVAAVSTIASLFYSEVAGFAPCELCWFQRIFMYPQVILLGLAVWKKDTRIIMYSLAVAGVGAVISLYHNYMYYMDGGLKVACGIINDGVSCVQRYVFEFGYITVPVMALTAFALVIMFLVFAQNYSKNHA